MAEKKDTQEKQPTIQDIQAFNRTSLTDTARDIINFAEDNGTSMDKVLASMGMEIDENKQRIEIDDTEPNEKELEEFMRMQSKPKAIPGQSLTENPDSAKPWERPPLFANPRDALEDVTQRLFQPESIKAVAQSLQKGASVGNVTELILYNDYHEGKYSVDVMLMLYEPIFYSVMNIGESANVNYRLDEDLRINDLDNNPKEKEQETLSSIKDIRRTVMAKEPNLKAMPKNFSEQTKLAKSLLERGV
tara:strand:+ start:2961 stop:3701 length:741 start_codon:yes stop_codon:yes gene_type:complete